MWRRAPQRKAVGAGPRYYRIPPVWGLVFLLVLVVLVIVLLFRVG